MEDDIYDNILEEFDLLSEDYHHDTDEAPGVDFESFDYNLNSPLLPNAADEFYKLHTEQKQMIREDWDFISHHLDKENSDLRTSNHHHKLIPQLMHQTLSSIDLNVDLLNRWKDFGSVASLPIIETLKFLKAPHDVMSSYRTKFEAIERNICGVRDDFEAFLKFHILILIMNSRLRQDRSSWCPQVIINMVIHEFKKEKYVTVGGSQGTDWVVGKDLIGNVPLGLVFDRNFLLMLKDIAASRFNTKITMIDRLDKKFNKNDIRNLQILYKAGDTILQKMGNDGYKLIKFIEPECISRFSELAHRYRPLIPFSPSLRNHLNSELNKLGFDYKLIKDLMYIIRESENVEFVAQCYGAFRHWGHPYLDVLGGLEDLYSRVQEEIPVDEAYANILGSDLAYYVLSDRFKKDKKWFVDEEKLPKNHILKGHIKNATWPTQKQINDFGPHWHELPIIPCFEVPEALDLSDLYADKAHSLTKTEIINHLKKTTLYSIPTKRVMSTLLQKPSFNIREFLQKINDLGLDEEFLTIGLKPKERELKIKPRFFALMSWELRLYFVITELLIKKYYMPLFSGVTMADDMTTVLKKMIVLTEGQGNLNYSKVYIANGLDYEKWNNKQRAQSNDPVFRVMGQFLGMNNIFTYTFEAFSKCLVYYPDRPDLMRVGPNNTVESSRGSKVCWKGQLGGFEGLRQKGWTVHGGLMLRREAMSLNTKTQFLAQGDNQTVITQYSIEGSYDELTLKKRINEVWDNNTTIMSRIRQAAEKLGLRINADEVMTSADFLVYGKIPIFRSKLIPLESKRWARVNSLDNDQIPSLGNSIANVTTSALMVSQHSNSPIDAMSNYGYLGSWVLALHSLFSPIIGSDPFKMKKGLSDQKLKALIFRTLFKDPSIGGITGMNLWRFFIRGFPDPVTESLSWWKTIANLTGDQTLKDIAGEVGNPKMGEKNLRSFTKLLEDPMSLNVPGSLSSETYIKEEIRTSLHRAGNEIKNQIIRKSIQYSFKNRDATINYLMGVKPRFPRFLSEFYSSTFLRMTEGVVELFSNCRTIRKNFSRKMSEKIGQIIMQSELKAHESLTASFRRSAPLWSCSSSRADLLRIRSWGVDIIGTTVPHPSELLAGTQICSDSCSKECVTVKVSRATRMNLWERGPMIPYLGSKTSESTSIYQPWEKDSEVPLLKKAIRLRRAIGWFIDADSPLTKSIFNNLSALTGEDAYEELDTFARTGSALHRFYASRQSNEGQPGISYNLLTHVFVTTDSMERLNEKNYDFMYQTLLLWSEVIVVCQTNIISRNEGCYHLHMNCEGCLRELKDCKISHIEEWKFEDVSREIEEMTALSVKLKITKKLNIGRTYPWDQISHNAKSKTLGESQGLLWAIHCNTGDLEDSSNAIFPFTILKRVAPLSFLMGLAKGLLVGASIRTLQRRFTSQSDTHLIAYQGSYWHLVNLAVKETNLSCLAEFEGFREILEQEGGDVLKSYPTKKEESATVVKMWLLKQLSLFIGSPRDYSFDRLIIFADMNIETVRSLCGLAAMVWPAFKSPSLTTDGLNRIQQGRICLEIVMSIKRGVATEEDQNKLKTLLIHSTRAVPQFLVSQEARHAISGHERTRGYLAPPRTLKNPERRYFENGETINCSYEMKESSESDLTGWLKQLEMTEQIRSPLVSSKRLAQLSTGAHYKLISILEGNFNRKDGLFIGDGSGGMGANYLLQNKRSKVIFNSLYDPIGVNMSGMKPGGPGAYLSAGVNDRCVNFRTSWKHPSDLADKSTWIYFSHLIEDWDLQIGVICCDAEVRSLEETLKIENNIMDYLDKFLTNESDVLIYKTYFENLRNPKSLPHRLGEFFTRIICKLPWAQGSFTSEVYFVASGFRKCVQPRESLLSTESLMDIHSKLRVNQSFEKEFERARLLTAERMTYGLMRYVPFLQIESIGSFFISLGVRSGWGLSLAHAYCDYINNDQLHPYCFMITLAAFVSQSIMDIFSRYKPSLKMPATNQLIKLSSFLFGLWSSVLILTEDIEKCKEIHSYFQGPTAVSFRVIMVKDKRGVSHPYPTWKFCRGKNEKIFDIGSRMALAQSIGRLVNVLFRDWSGRGWGDIDDAVLETILQSSNSNATLGDFNQRTNILPNLSNSFSELTEINRIMEDEDFTDVLVDGIEINEFIGTQ